MRIAYGAHALTGALEYPASPEETMRINRARACEWAAWALLNLNTVLMMPWVPLSSVLPETPENRDRGLRADLAVIGRCDSIWLCGAMISGGMAIEVSEARRLGLPVIDFTVLGYRFPPALSAPGERERVERILMLEAA